MIKLHTLPWITHREWKVISFGFPYLDSPWCVALFWGPETPQLQNLDWWPPRLFSFFFTQVNGNFINLLFFLMVSAFFPGHPYWTWLYPRHLKNLIPSSCLRNSLTMPLPLSLFEYPLCWILGLGGRIGLRGEVRPWVGACICFLSFCILLYFNS